MAVSVVGISHRSAPLAVRERFAIPPDVGDTVVRGIVSEGCDEAVLLSTCNRTELYLRAPGDHVDAPALGTRVLRAHSGLGESEADSYLYTMHGTAAARHLFRVVSSLDSMVVGEAQIQGQVRDAYGRAVELRGTEYSVGPILSRLFETALRVGSRVRGETRLGEGAASVPGAAVALAIRELGPLAGRRAVVLGAGEMSALTARCLRDQRVEQIIVTNRTDAHADEVARSVDAAHAGFDRLPELLRTADVVVSATSAPHVLITRALVETARHGVRAPLVILDIALPRDVDPEVGRLTGVTLFDLDDLSRVISGTLERRRSELDTAETIIEEGVGEFETWYRTRRVVPFIRTMRGEAENLRRREMRRARSRLAGLSAEELEAVDRLTRRLLNKVLHAPTTRLREAAANGRADEVVNLAGYLFALDDTGNRNGEGE